MSFVKYIKLSSLLFACFLPGCFTETEKRPKRTPTLFVLNLLDKKFHDNCHIKGSTQVSLENLEKFASTLPKTTEIVVYCSNYFCTTSEIAAKILQKMGFEQVWVYEGGLAEWYQKGWPIEGSCTLKYLKKVVKKPKEGAQGVAVITAEQLKQKIETHSYAAA